MADTKLSGLVALTGANVASGDLFVTVDISDTTMSASGTDKKITADEFRAFLTANGVSRRVLNASVSTDAGTFAADTYLTGSQIAIPSSSLQAKSMYRCVFNVTKTGAGTATPIINIRFGTAGSTADTSRGTLTWTAQTGVADEGMFEIWATFRTVGSGTTAVLQTTGRLTHRLVATGFGNTAVSEPEIATSGGFDSTVASSIIGLSVNGGASAVWTISMVQSELFNLV